MMHSDFHGWKIDRRIPIALIMALCLQMAGVLIWATELNARVSHMEKQTYNTEQMHEKFIRLDERLESVRLQLDRLNNHLDQVSSRLMKRG